MVGLSYTVVEVDDKNEKRFLEHIRKDPLNYHFFLQDWFEERQVSRFYLALEKGRIRGLMLVYKDKIAQLKGSARAIEVLLDALDPNVTELSVPYEHRGSLLRRFRPRFKSEMDLLHLTKGRQNPQIVHRPVALKAKDAKVVLRLLLEADPRMWKHFSTKTVKRSMRTNLWIGIKDHGKPVAIGNARSRKRYGHIYTIATAPNFRGKGFATSIVSALVLKLFNDSKDLLIYVFRTNVPANIVYRKVGFRLYKRMMYVDGERIKKKMLKN